MNAPDLSVSPNASRRVPGVNVPVAAPSSAVDLTVAASCRSERPFAGGNCPEEGCSAAGSSETADGSACVDAVETDEAVVAVVVAAAALVEVAGEATDVALEDEEPHPAIAQPASANATIG